VKVSRTQELVAEIVAARYGISMTVSWRGRVIVQIYPQEPLRIPSVQLPAVRCSALGRRPASAYNTVLVVDRALGLGPGLWAATIGHFSGAEDGCKPGRTGHALTYPHGYGRDFSDCLTGFVPAARDKHVKLADDGLIEPQWVCLPNSSLGQNTKDRKSYSSPSSPTGSRSTATTYKIEVAKVASGNGGVPSWNWES
jgi:hypothetical protein